MGTFGFFDVLPKGREEYGPTHALPDWAKVTMGMKMIARRSWPADARRSNNGGTKKAGRKCSGLNPIHSVCKPQRERPPAGNHPKRTFGAEVATQNPR
jgi:hypothetical protein